MKNYFAPKNWSNIALGEDGTLEYILQKPKKLLSQIAVIGIFISTVQSLIDLRGLPDLFFYLQLIIRLSFFFLIYMLNERGKHTAAVIIFFCFANSFIFTFSNLLPPNVGIHYIFFATITLSFVFYSAKKRIAIIFSLLPVILLLTTLYYDFALFKNLSHGINITHGSQFSVIITSTLIIYSITFIVKLNTEMLNYFKKISAESLLKSKDLTKVNAELDRFVYSISHELRAPLLSVLGLTNLMDYEVRDEGLKIYIEKIKSSVINLDEFIEEILAYSQNSRIEIKPEPVDIEAIIEAIIESISFMDGVKFVSIKKNIKFKHKIMIDRSRIFTIMKNLIINAIKYRNCTIDCHLSITATFKNRFLNVQIKDNGIGIPQEQQDRVFDMFYRASTLSSGSGLGLYIVLEMLGKINGKIWLKSTPGEGSAFTFEIPCEASVL
jgi:signal transduction histidine kinase